MQNNVPISCKRALTQMWPPRRLPFSPHERQPKQTLTINPRVLHQQTGVADIPSWMLGPCGLTARHQGLYSIPGHHSASWLPTGQCERKLLEAQPGRFWPRNRSFTEAILESVAGTASPNTAKVTKRPQLDYARFSIRDTSHQGLAFDDGRRPDFQS